jgi:hypothetical protein
MSIFPTPKLNISIPLTQRLAPPAFTPPTYIPTLIKDPPFTRENLFKLLFSHLLKPVTIRLKPGEFVKLSEDLYVKMKESGVIEFYELIE